MTKTKGFLLAVAVAAMAFTFSCSSDEGGGGGGSGSSSSGGGGGNACTDLEPITIGSQTWAKKNLNCDVAGSKCYDNDPDNCETYGRLYDWATAMKIEASFNGSSWDGSDANHRGICPSGWHIPSYDEWNVLAEYVLQDVAKLKARNGWNNGGNGTNDYNFSALPGGRGSPDGNSNGFSYLGDRGSWWSATETSSGGAYRLLIYDNDEANWSHGNKIYLLSVRCIKG